MEWGRVSLIAFELQTHQFTTGFRYFEGEGVRTFPATGLEP
jgi:hypothetical protein